VEIDGRSLDFETAVTDDNHTSPIVPTWVGEQLEK
jgi:hypothetical protein